MKFDTVMKDAITNKKKVKISFFSKEDNKIIERLCAPFDIGPSRKYHDQSDRYHFWDYESDKKNHVLSLVDGQVTNILITNEPFEPSSIITWDISKNPWFIKRDWGIFS
ncbi:hypothetical protein [Acinetobacter portensis]|uniref:hypothetical protein n=1 Tax=Acinetobacter portensis TaxID=1839785 RepID=UPI0013D8D51A|nr:hypothetical protein [Acinetobacter portensis]